ncbi:lipopolysaccharide biosynthesis protein [Bizionia sp.]|uniref:lipopolysaccharide biosynthesis protein n=1 Tax=Bizionia sp. TaxID=1954480 RepID=UPI003A9022A4
MFKFLKQYAIFGVVFMVAKATVYFIPLLLADVLTKSDFGVLEYALAGLGMIVNTIINLGVPGAYPYFILREEKVELKPAFKLHAVILFIPFALNQVLYFFFNLDVVFYLAFNISYIIANQVFYSTQLKSHEKSTPSVIIDSGIYLVLLVAYVLDKLNLLDVNLQLINVFVLTYSLVYVVYGIINYYKVKEEATLLGYKTILKFSIHLLISTFLIFLITTSGRILVELFFDFETVGIYAFYFRLSAVVVMIHQVINIAFFKKIYTFNPEVLDKYFYLFFIFIFCLSVVIQFIAPFIITHFSDYFNDTYQAYKTVYFLLSAQMVMWIASALNSNIIDRENLASKNNIKFLILVFISILLFYAVQNYLTLALLTFLHMSIIFVACLLQYSSLYSKGIYFKKSAITLIIIYFITSVYYFYTI